MYTVKEINDSIEWVKRRIDKSSLPVKSHLDFTQGKAMIEAAVQREMEMPFRRAVETCPDNVVSKATERLIRDFGAWDPNKDEIFPISA